MADDKFLSFGIALSAALFVSFISYKIFFEKKFFFKTKVKKLIIYPIKSVKGIPVDYLEICKSGVKYKKCHDRGYVLVDSNYNFITLRTDPSLYKVNTYFEGDNIVLEADGLEKIKIDTSYKIKKGDLVIQTKIWGDEIEGLDCGDKVANWFSKVLNKPVRLLKHDSKLNFRKSTGLVNEEQKKLNDVPIIYQDDANILIINEKSVENLKDVIVTENGTKTSIDYTRFRPNILIETDIPYEEDSWETLKINNTVLQKNFSCSRCRVTTLNSETLEFESEPLNTLKKHRLGPKKTFGLNPLFGVFLMPKKLGKINVNDNIYVN